MYSSRFGLCLSYSLALFLGTIASASGSSISVKASGTPAAGVYPSFTVYVNDTAIGTQASVSATLQTYSFSTTLANSAIRRVMVQYTNDATIGAENRNLTLQSVVLDGVETLSTASTVTYDTGALDARYARAGATLMDINGYMVFKFQNQVPVIAASDLVMNVGETATLSIASTDPDQDPIAISYGTGMPSFGTFSAPAASTGTATVVFAPTTGQNGVSSIVFRAADTYGGYGYKTVKVTVNSAITVTGPTPATANVLEGQSATMSLGATSSAGKPISWTTTGAPAMATLTDLGGGNAQIALSPASGSAGSYTFQAIASDGVSPTVTTPITFQVSRAVLVKASGTPASGIYPIFNVYVNDQLIGTQTVSASLQTYAFPTTLPNSSTRRVMVQYTNDATIGSEDRNLTVQSIVLDGVETSSTASSVIYDMGTLDALYTQAGSSLMNINGYLVFPFLNQVPVVTASDIVMNVGETANVSIASTDPDQDAMAITTGAGMPSFAILTAGAPGAATLTLAPTTGQNGVYPIVLKATDTYGGVGIKTINVTVNSSITVTGPTPASIVVLEGQSMTVNLSATSSAGRTVAWTASGAPAMASLTNLGNGGAQLVLNPASGSAGSYSLQAIASDGVSPTVTTPITFQVSRAILVKASGTPASGIYPSFNVYVNDQLIGTQAAVSASLQTYSFATTLPKTSIRRIMVQYTNDATIGSEDRNLTLQSVTLDGVTTASTASTVVYDTGALDARYARVGSTLMDVNGYMVFPFLNQVPVITAPDLVMNTGDTATLSISSTDADLDPVAVSYGSGMPAFGVFSAPAASNGTATITFTPSIGQAGVSSIVLRAADTYGGYGYKTVKVTVNDIPGTLFVAQTGVDSNPGTSLLPFKTIQKAANVAVPGNKIYVRAGTYRETVTPTNSGTSASPIIFAAYPGEAPVVSGADVLTSWGNTSGATYSSAMPWSLGAGRDQLFVDGRMILEARWPNGTTSVSTPVKSVVESVSNVSHTTTGPSSGMTATLSDSHLTQAAGYWVGARIILITGSQWNSIYGTVTASVPGQITILVPKLTSSVTYYDPLVGNPYWLEGIPSELDSNGEWFRDSSSGAVSARMPAGDSPSTHVVEAKRRDFGFDLTAQSYIQLQGISLFATSLKTGPTSTGIVLDGLQARYVSHNFVPTNTNTSTTGLMLDGVGNVLKNCEISFSAGNGVRLTGSGHTVTNCVIHDTDYGADYSACISVAGSDNVMTRNTMYRTGRSAINHGGKNNKILNNEMFDYGLQTSDLGGTYTYGNDGGDTEIAYNLAHGSGSGRSAPNSGVYLDGGSFDYLVHHNVVWDTESGMNVNGFETSQTPPPNNDANIRVYQNSVYGTSSCAIGGAQNLAVTGYFIANNLCSGATYLMAAAVLQTNLRDITFYSNFQAPEQFDFRLKAGAQAIGMGSSFGGSSPDVGALPAGSNLFTAGASRTWPQAPSGLTAVAIGNTTVQLNWPTVPAGTSLIRVSRGSAGGASHEIAALPATATSFLDTGLAQNTPQAYFIRAEAASGYISPALNRVSTRTLGSSPAAGMKQAEAPDNASGLDIKNSMVSGIDAGDWLSYTNLDFGTGAYAHVRLVMETSSGPTNYEVHLDSLTGPLIGTGVIRLGVTPTTWHYMVADLSPVPTGVHSIYIVFKGTLTGSMDYLEFY